MSPDGILHFAEGAANLMSVTSAVNLSLHSPKRPDQCQPNMRRSLSTMMLQTGDAKKVWVSFPTSNGKT